MRADPRRSPSIPASRSSCLHGPRFMRQERSGRTSLEKVEHLLRSRKTEVRISFRAAIVWRLLVLGQRPQEVAAVLGTTTKTVRKWRERFLAHGVEGV